MSNAAAYFVTRHTAEGRANAPAFVEADGPARSLSYGALGEACAHWAGALRRADIRREERVAMILHDQLEFPIVFWGSLWAGVVPIPVNTLLAAPVYQAILADSRATALVISAPLYDTVAPILASLPDLKHVIVVGDAPAGTRSYADFVAGAQPAAMIEANDDETAFWLYSSGSTGTPKGVRHVHGSLKATADTFGAQVLGVRAEDTVFSVAKLFFAYGLGNGMSFPMSVGARAVLLAGRPTPDSVGAIMDAHRPSLFCAVPTLYAALVSAQEASGKAPTHKPRLGVSAGEALPREVGVRWEKLWGCPIVDGVGSTEMLHIFLSNRPDDVVYGTSGRAVPGYEVRLVGDGDLEVGEGEIGELLVRGPSAAEGYWNRREKSQATFQGEWTRTGDKYERTPEGRFVYAGRTDDMFKVSGIWVSPFEVEQALIEDPAVLEAAVVGRMDDAGLLKPAAYVVLKPGATLDARALKDHVKERVGLWKYPRWIEVVEDLPKTATGKIQRFKLRQRA